MKKCVFIPLRDKKLHKNKDLVTWPDVSTFEITFKYRKLCRKEREYCKGVMVSDQIYLWNAN